MNRKLKATGSKLDLVVLEAQYVSRSLTTASGSPAESGTDVDPGADAHYDDGPKASAPIAVDSNEGAGAYQGVATIDGRSLLVHPEARHVLVMKQPNQQLGLLLETLPGGNPCTYITDIIPNGVVERTCSDQVREGDVIAGVNGVPMLYLSHAEVKRHLAEGALSPSGLRLSLIHKDIVHTQFANEVGEFPLTPPTANAAANRGGPMSKTDSWAETDSFMPLTAVSAMSHADVRTVTIEQKEGEKLGMRLIANPGGKRGTRITAIHEGGLVHRQAAGQVLYGDVIVGINGEPVLDENHADVRERIQTAEGTLVLTLLHEVVVDKDSEDVPPEDAPSGPESPKPTGFLEHAAARHLSIKKQPNEPLGLKISTGFEGLRGARIVEIQESGAVHRIHPEGLQIGDVLVAINDIEVLDDSHDEIIDKLKTATNSSAGLLLTVLSARHVDDPKILLQHPNVRHVTVKKEKGKNLGVALQTYPELRGTRLSQVKKKGALHNQHRERVAIGDVVVGINSDPVFHSEHEDVVDKLVSASEGEYLTLSLIQAVDLEDIGYSVARDQSPPPMPRPSSVGRGSTRPLSSRDSMLSPVKQVNATPLRGQKLGLAIRTEPDQDHPDLSIHTIHAMKPGSAADENGEIEEQDVIVAVNGQSVVHMSHDDVIALMRTYSDGELHLTLIPVTELNEYLSENGLKPGVLPDATGDDQTSSQKEVVSPERTVADRNSPSKSPLSTGDPVLDQSIRKAEEEAALVGYEEHPSQIDPAIDDEPTDEHVPGYEEDRLALAHDKHMSDLDNMAVCAPTEAQRHHAEHKLAEEKHREDVGTNLLEHLDERFEEATKKFGSGQSDPPADRGIRTVTLSRAEGPLGLKLIGDENHRGARVLQVAPNSQAENSGIIFPGDRIQALNGIRLDSLPHHKIHSLMGGDSVELEIAHDDAPLPQPVGDDDVQVGTDSEDFEIAEVSLNVQKSAPLDLHFYTVPDASGVRIRNVRNTSADSKDGVLREHDCILSVNNEDVRWSTPMEVSKLLAEVEGPVALRVMRHTDPVGMPRALMLPIHDQDPGFTLTDGEHLDSNEAGRVGIFVSTVNQSVNGTNDLEVSDRLLAINGASVLCSTLKEATDLLHRMCADSQSVGLDIIKATDEGNSTFWSTICSHARQANGDVGPDGNVGLRIYSDENDLVSARILHVESGSPAHATGIRAGDVLLSVDDELVVSKSHSEIVTLLRNRSDETISLGFAQPPKPTHNCGSLEKKFTVRGGPNGGEHGIHADESAEGFVIVSQIEEGSDAERLASIGELGIGDVILAVNDTDALSAGLATTRAQLETPGSVSLTVMSSNAEIFDPASRDNTSSSLRGGEASRKTASPGGILQIEPGREDGGSTVLGDHQGRPRSIESGRNTTTPNEHAGWPRSTSPKRDGGESVDSVHFDGVERRIGGYSSDTTSGDVTFPGSTLAPSTETGGESGGGRAFFSTDGEITSVTSVENDSDMQSASPRIDEMRKRVSAEKRRKQQNSQPLQTGEADRNRFETYSVGSSPDRQAQSPLKLAAERAAAKHRAVTSPKHDYSSMNRIQLLRVCHERGISVPDEIHNDPEAIRELIRAEDKRAGPQPLPSSPLAAEQRGISPQSEVMGSPESRGSITPQDDRFLAGMPTNVSVTSPGPSPVDEVGTSPSSSGLVGSFDVTSEREEVAEYDRTFTKITVLEAINKLGFKTEKHTIRVNKVCVPLLSFLLR